MPRNLGNINCFNFYLGTLRLSFFKEEYFRIFVVLHHILSRHPFFVEKMKESLGKKISVSDLLLHPALKDNDIKLELMHFYHLMTLNQSFRRLQLSFANILVQLYLYKV